MPSPLVCEVRQLIRDREQDGRPLTMPERALLLATLVPPRRDGTDVVDELEAAIVDLRRHALGATMPDETRAAARRMLAAARAVLDYRPADVDPSACLATMPADPRRKRADVDG